jgi:hypothetical protein
MNWQVIKQIAQTKKRQFMLEQTKAARRAQIGDKK